ncbi:MAG: beta-lactamase family protein [Ardenticatenaceae bacterium]|nr:beta-lactamase family protein [Ardenticatenaceae bacterium]MCB9003990.1 beta-lactamase family protein [Ardenticatenaceae bacterium]
MKKYILMIVGVALLALAVGCKAQREAYDALDQLMRERFPADGTAVVLVVDAPGVGEQILRSGMGNLERNEAIKSTSHFRIGDITKTFVSTVVFQLIEEGKVGLDDTLPQHFAAEITDNIPNAQDITIRQLLNMSSGIADYRDNPDFVAALTADPFKHWQPEEALAFAYGQEPLQAPGAGFAYSNTNYILLQILIEQEFSDILAEVLRDRVLDKLTLDDTYLEISEDIAVGYVPGYVMENGRYADTLSLGDARGLGDEGLISNALNLAEYVPALYERSFTWENGRAESLATLPMGNGDEYGLGIMRRDSAWGPMWGHDNQQPGFAGEMWYLPDHETTIVLLSNGATKEELAAFANEVLEVVLGEN